MTRELTRKMTALMLCLALTVPLCINTTKAADKLITPKCTYTYYKKDTLDLVICTVDKRSDTPEYICLNVYNNGKLIRSSEFKPKWNGTPGYTTISITGLKPLQTYKISMRTKTDEAESGELVVTKKTVGAVPATNGTYAKNLRASMKKGKTFVFRFPCIVEDNDALQWVNKVKYGYPQYSFYKCEINHGDGGTCSFITFKADPAGSQKYLKALNVAKKIAKTAKKKKTKKEKIKYVNSKLCKICKYNESAADRGTPYGCLIKHKAVCRGYAIAFDMIMEELKIPHQYIESKDHAWNRVKVSGKWYYVDVTWNDCYSKKTAYLMVKKHPEAKRITVIR